MKSKIISILISAGLLFAGCAENKTVKDTGINPIEEVTQASVDSLAKGDKVTTSSTVKTEEKIKSELSKSASSASQASSDEGHNMHATLPENLKNAENPKFKVDSEVTVLADHMPGMKGAKGEIAGAFDTVLYSVTYEPVGGGEKVTDHKWIVLEETENPPADGFREGDEVTILADHMKNMKGAKGKIVTVKKGPAYTITYTPTNGGEMVKNHMWVSEDEIIAE